MVENKENGENDQIELAIRELMEDDKSMLALLNLVKMLKDSADLEAIQKLAEQFIPGNPAMIIQTADQPEFHKGGINLINLIVALMASVSSKTSQESISTILYNSDELWESMVDGAKKPENFSLLRLMGVLKDPEIAAGLTAILNALKVLGAMLKRVDRGEGE
ncbi:MAG: DUF1641 domain-containing protein [Candidatus Thermoplasmatota archaeon]|jgi:uncharacterized protein YjgD (DUF1641 family)|nr:DUF1641 domain-containing protein [Candidatus Thermoplasmatota archaeon]MCL5790362.1 DUF1641 domain-containing protein [Candidatus Thermoplasmatota archaeon]